MGAAGLGKESPSRPTGNSSGWTVNWRGLVAVLLIATTVVIAWRSLEDSPVGPNAGDRSDQLDPSTTSAPPQPVGQSAPGTSPGRSTTTTRRPRTTGPPATTTVAAARQVLISGETKPCRFGPNCLVASFTIDGFDEHPGRFVCIYSNSRNDFGFSNDGVDDACFTADIGDTITIEVDGVRSATISEQNLDGP